jgi:hypothetical protein
MLKSFTKQLLGNSIRILLIILLIFLILFWIPVFWKADVKLIKESFANEYYKTVVDIGKILFGFWLANIFLKKSQTREFTLRIQQQWQEKIINLHRAILLLESVPDNPDISIKGLTERIRDNDIGLCYLSELISEHGDRDKLGLLGDIAFEYREDIHNHIKKILESLELGEIICLRPFSKEISEDINLIKEKLFT